jgi:hypothetical protein
MGYANTTMGGSSSSKLVMEIEVEKSHLRRLSKTHNTTTNETSSPSPYLGKHILHYSITNTYKTHP